MTPRITKELRPIDRSQDLQPGDSFIVYYKNAEIGSRKDLWLGIICPEPLMPNILRKKPHKNSKPETGDWNVPVEERAHAVYLPGKNTYQWLEKKNLFQVEASPPSLLACDIRTDSKLFLSLHKLARKNPKPDFWFRMAAEERKVKGILGRTPSLVLPPKRNVESNGKIADTLAKDFQKRPLNSIIDRYGCLLAQKKPQLEGNLPDLFPEAHGSDPPTPVVNATRLGSPPDSNSEASSSNPSTPVMNATTGGELVARAPSFHFNIPVSTHSLENLSPERRLAEKPMPKARCVYRSVATQTTFEPIRSSLSGDALVDTYIGSGTDQGVFQLTRRIISKCSFLKYYLVDGDHPFIFHPDLYGEPGEGSGAISPG